MSYTTLEAALKTVLLLATSTFKSGDVTLGDYRVLDSGTDETHGTNKAVLVPGAGPNVSIANYTTSHTWDILVDLFTVYQQDSDWSGFKTARDATIAQIELYPTLNLHDSTLVQDITSEGDPQDVFDTEHGGPFFIFQRIRVTVEERVALSGGEFA